MSLVRSSLSLFKSACLSSSLSPFLSHCSSSVLHSVPSVSARLQSSPLFLSLFNSIQFRSSVSVCVRFCPSLSISSLLSSFPLCPSLFVPSHLRSSPIHSSCLVSSPLGSIYLYLSVFVSIHLCLSCSCSQSLPISSNNSLSLLRRSRVVYFRKTLLSLLDVIAFSLMIGSPALL